MTFSVTEIETAKTFRLTIGLSCEDNPSTTNLTKPSRLFSIKQLLNFHIPSYLRRGQQVNSNEEPSDVLGAQEKQARFRAIYIIDLHTVTSCASTTAPLTSWTTDDGFSMLELPFALVSVLLPRRKFSLRLLRERSFSPHVLIGCTVCLVKSTARDAIYKSRENH